MVKIAVVKSLHIQFETFSNKFYFIMSSERRRAHENMINCVEGLYLQGNLVIILLIQL